MYSERTQDRLADIVDDADRLGRILGDRTFDAFVADEMMVLAAERLLQRITEAVIQIGPTDMASVAPDLLIERIRGFGNRLRHEYRNLDARLVFAIATEGVPPLRAAAARALES
jgi:uncharacterized protein with HEPN domain